jgi:hypothetical protein
MRTARAGAARELLTRRRLDRVAKVTSRTSTLPAWGTGGGRSTVITLAEPGAGVLVAGIADVRSRGLATYP